mmetsp:Transcript_19171/g.55038  ORF Transcript_19171/g.55038 Transcript_19171/m.55038 type:complete len:553 (+) Transcript_19171:97-1755(+)
MIDEASLVAGFDMLKVMFFRVSGAAFVIYPLIIMAQLMASGAMSTKDMAAAEAQETEGKPVDTPTSMEPPTPSKPKGPYVAAGCRWKRLASRRSSAITIIVAVMILAAAAAVTGRSIAFLVAAPASPASSRNQATAHTLEVEQKLPPVGELDSATMPTSQPGRDGAWGSMGKVVAGVVAASFAAVGLSVCRRQQRRPARPVAASDSASVCTKRLPRAGRVLRSVVASGSASEVMDIAPAKTAEIDDRVKRYVAPAPPDQSYWHHVDLHVRDWVDWDTGLFRYVNEMPRGSLQKFEVQPNHEKNAISEDPVGSDRLASFGRPVPFNYGCLPQTYRDPGKVCDIVSAPGDDDPLDIFDLSESVVGVGEVVQCRVLGAVCLIDEGQADWKILAVNTEHDGPLSEARTVDDVERIAPGRVQECLQWMDDFKQSNSADSAKLDFTIYGADTALKLIQADHASWKNLVNNTGLDGKSNGHWIRAPHSRSHSLKIPVPVPNPPSRAVPGKILSAPASLVGVSREAVLLNAFPQQRALTSPKEHNCMEEHNRDFERVTSP